MKVISIRLLILLPLLLAGLGCHSDGPIAPGGADAPPAWVGTAGIVSVVAGDSVVTVYWGEAVDFQDPPVTYLVYKDVDDSPWDQPPVLRKDNDPYAFTGLENGVTYWFGVQCRDSAKPPHVDGNTKVLNAMPRSADVTPPVWDSTVGVVSVVPWDGEVTVYWGTATDAQSPPVEYLVYEDEDSNPWDQEPVVTDTNDPYTFSTLQDDVEYWFGVRCRDSAVPQNIDANDVVLSATPKVHGWARTWGGTGSDSSSDVAVDSDGNAFVVGTFEGTVDFDPGPGVDIHTAVTSEDVFLSRFDSSGTFQWARTWGGYSSYGGPLVTTSSTGDIYVGAEYAGTVDLDPGPGVDLHSCYMEAAYVSKFDSSGSYQWADTWATSSSSARVEAISVNDSGYTYTCGQLGWGIDSCTTYARKTSPDGAEVWMFEWKDVVSASGPSPFADSIAVDNSENVYVIGYFNSAADFDPDPGVDQHAPGGDADSFLSAFDSAGTYKWTRTWGGSGDSDCFAECAVSGDPDGVYVGGEFSGEVDFDPGAGFDIHTSTGLLDSFLSRFNSLGDHQWTRTWGGSGVIANVDDLKVRNAQTVVAEGYALGGTVDLDPGPGVSEYDASEWIRYLSWFNSSGAYSHSLILDPSFDGSAFDQCDNIYTVGAFQLTVDFNPGPGVDEHTSNGDRDVFLTKYLPDGSW